MIKWPDFRNPSKFGDVFTVILVYVAVIFVLSEVLTGDALRNLLLASLIFISGWSIWAVHSILEQHANDGEEAH